MNLVTKCTYGMATAVIIASLMSASASLAQSFLVIPKVMQFQTIGSVPLEININAGEEFGDARFELEGRGAEDGWTVFLRRSDQQSFEISPDNLNKYLIYDNVFSIPLSGSNRIKIEATGVAPRLRLVSIVKTTPLSGNLYPQAPFNLRPLVNSAASPTDTAVSSAIFYLKTDTKSGAFKSCSAFQIASGVFLTAMHCVSIVVNDKCDAIGNGAIFLYPQLEGSLSGQMSADNKKSAVSAQVLLCGDLSSFDFENQQSKTDYAILVAKDTLDKKSLIKLDLQPVENNTLLSAYAVLMNRIENWANPQNKEYPPSKYVSDDSACKASADTDNVCPAGQIFHKCDTTESMSGGLVTRRNTVNVVALHYYGTYLGNCAVPIRTILTDMRSKIKSPLQEKLLLPLVSGQQP